MSGAESRAVGALDLTGSVGRRERSLPARLSGGAWKFAHRKPLGALGLVILVAMLVAAIFADTLAPYDPITPVGIPLHGPTAEHLFGTDHLGRDVFSRILIGARSSLYTSVVVVTLTLVIGSAVGAVCGYVGGNVDLMVQRLIDGFMAFPPLVLTLTIVSALDSNVILSVNTAVVAALTVALVPGNARLIRSVTLSERVTAYVDASRMIGCTHLRILWRHILPNITAQMIVIASIQLGVVILAESALSFLGYGTPPPAPTWGGMLTSSGTRFMIVAPYLAIIPGVALSLAVLSFNLFGDALRDVLDPRLRT